MTSRLQPSTFSFFLASRQQRAYHLPIVKRLLTLPLLVLVFFCSHASAQFPPVRRVSIRGQIYAPDGTAMLANIRFRLSSDEGQGPAEDLFTDSKGSFELPNKVQDASYTLTVESDGKNWATTKERFNAIGPRPFILVHLLPLEGSRVAGASISVAELNKNVPRAARRQFETAVEQLAAGDADHARKGFERAIELYPDFVEARSELAVVLMRNGDLTRAETLLRRAVELDAGAVRPQLNLGLCLYRQQRFTDALPFLERGVQLQPVNPNANLLYGIALAMTGDDVRAEPVLVRAYEQGGKAYAMAQLHLTRLYTRQKKYDRAAAALEAYLRDVPGDPNAESLRATLVKLRAAAARP